MLRFIDRPEGQRVPRHLRIQEFSQLSDALVACTSSESALASAMYYWGFRFVRGGAA
jgi:hypothetical protein